MLHASGAVPGTLVNEADRAAPVDYGPGPGQPRAKTRPARLFAAPAGSGPAIPIGNPAASTGGVFGPAVDWPIIMIHAVLLPDGRVMTYGTDQNGIQGGQWVYDVWDPALGTDTTSHTVLANTTKTNIFCSAQSVDWGTGNVVVAGGSLKTAPGETNESIDNTTLFTPATNQISDSVPMVYKRWYPSIVPLPSGEMLVLGGRSALSVPTLTPEIYNRATGWRTLDGATSTAAFGNQSRDWFYPRGWVAPDGSIFQVNPDGAMYSLSTAGTGSITSYAQNILPGSYDLPTLMFWPGRLLSLRANAQADIIDLNGPSPVVTQTASLSQVRFWASGTIMPDGRVLVTGGSTVANDVTSTVAYQAEIWNPATNQWTLGAAATKPRLYHSNALLLPDATVLTGGGGAPGPVKNLNAEIYYPSYLYNKDGSGNAAARPTIVAAPTAAATGQTITLQVNPGDKIGRVTAVRSGSATHSANLEQRFFSLAYTQSGTTVTATLPADPNVMLPGYYMVFAFQRGTPSVARTMLVTGG